MNERIRELMVQSDYPAPDIAKRPQKLVELVVLECCDVLLKWKNEPFPFDEDLAVSLLKEHFGVK